MDKPSFFKVIVSPALQLRRLMVPKRFVKKHGSNFFRLPDNTADRIYLRVPDSATTWPVDLVKKKKKKKKKKHNNNSGDGDDDDVVWLLGKGWPEFSKHYMVSLGYLLVFRYEAHSNCFLVIIFDTSASEIDYPRALSLSLSPTTCDLPVTTGALPVNGVSSDLLVTTRDLPVNAVCCDQLTTDADYDSHSSKKKVKRGDSYRPRKRKISASIDNVGGGGDKGIVKHSEREDGPMKRALAFKSNNPHFLLYMFPSYVAHRCNTHIPRCYSKLFHPCSTDDNTKSKANNTITLCLQQPTTTTDHVISWPVKYRFKDSRVSLSSGWIRFVSDNNIRVGDVCVFELIDPANMLYKVSICRATQT